MATTRAAKVTVHLLSWPEARLSVLIYGRIVRLFARIAKPDFTRSPMRGSFELSKWTRQNFVPIEQFIS
jgi:hypothetical protein